MNIFLKEKKQRIKKYNLQGAVGLLLSDGTVTSSV
jgi:hypothetical protein